MSVWWCIVHDTQAPFLADKQAGPGDCWAVASGERFSRCDIRPALVLVRDVPTSYDFWPDHLPLEALREKPLMMTGGDYALPGPNGLVYVLTAATGSISLDTTYEGVDNPQ